ncbi:hypothetical protein PZE19_11265 [Paludisphaera sp. Pla2]|uniref:Uncharacterized protein n=1 Tax=Paludisphaera mucosa TaxID=3030827 RepID=A0ABT6F9W1_9BACT|nr:hypothetical protein [Paludisphaera mucosa]MDG3004356.1 hypothetical protein [Paludisphaera mucosa]
MLLSASLPGSGSNWSECAAESVFVCAAGSSTLAVIWSVERASGPIAPTVQIPAA